MFLFVTLLGVIGLVCSGPAEDNSELPTTKALRCVAESLNATKTQGRGKSDCSQDNIFMIGLLQCEPMYPDFNFLTWFLEERPHDDWLIPLATTTPPTPTTTSKGTTTPIPTTPATSEQPPIYGARRIVSKYCDFSGSKGPKTDFFYMNFNDIWNDIREALDKSVGHDWHLARNEQEFCNIYNETFLGRSKEIALGRLKLLIQMDPSGIDLANDVMDYLERSVRLAYYANHFQHFRNKPIPDQCGNRWFPKSIMDL